MNLLLDANISWRMVVTLRTHFTSCFHVDNIGLAIPAKDADIWQFALANNLIIVTNDEDFLNFSNLKGFPPKVILLRTGNQSTEFIEDLLIKHKSDIEALDKSQEFGLLEIY